MAVILPRAEATYLVGLLAWILAAVVLCALRLLRVRHDWDLGDLSGVTLRVIAGIMFVVPILYWSVPHRGGVESYLR
jgi:hypothetical protein